MIRRKKCANPTGAAMSLSALLEAKKRKLAQTKGPNESSAPQAKKYKTRGEIDEEKRQALAPSPEVPLFFASAPPQKITQILICLLAYHYC